MNLAELVEACQNRCGFDDSAYRRKWIGFINESIREFSRRLPWDGLEDTLNVKTDGTKFVILPHYVDTVIGILNTSSHWPVERTGDLERQAPRSISQGTTGQVSNYDIAGEVPVARDPTGFMWFQSTHASDLLTVHVTGLVQNSGASGPTERTFKEVSISATGTSPATLGSLFTKVFSISKATETQGDFFFYDAGDTNAHLSFMATYETEAKFKRLELFYKPAAQTSLDVKFRYKIPPLRNDAQAPHPTVKADFIVSHAISLHLGEQEQWQKMQAAEMKADRVLTAEAHKDVNFNEPYNQVVPFGVPTDNERGL